MSNFQDHIAQRKDAAEQGTAIRRRLNVSAGEIALLFETMTDSQRALVISKFCVKCGSIKAAWCKHKEGGR